MKQKSSARGHVANNITMWKMALSLVRGGDYAHAGEEEAILLGMKGIPKNKGQILVDVGCGFGGTANFINKNHWGKVIGIDKDEEAIKHARNRYPDIEFYVCDVLNLEKLQIAKADVTYMFNSFYSFSDQSNALKKLNSISKSNADLMIFDYTILKNISESKHKRCLETIIHPINLDAIGRMLSDAGWSLNEAIDISDKYKLWYESLLEKISQKHQEITEMAGEKFFSHFYSTYDDIFQCIVEKSLGGAIIHASCSTSE